ncbi:MAG TPA: hypothetical protein VKA44_05630 [Gemmatimonadota bacterium]|nr:hypothetical protein [Gemmatimonadota bacterium]
MSEDAREALYRSRVRLLKLEGPHRRAWIEPFEEPLEFGVHGEIRAFYGAGTAEPIPTTLDHVVAATGG